MTSPTPPATGGLAPVIALLNDGNPAAALEQIRAQLTASPLDADLLHLAGVAARALGDLPAAIGWVGRAAALAPRQPDYQNTLGVLLRAQGFIDEAIAAYQRALDAVPGHLTTLANLANALEGAGRGQEAIPVVRELVGRQAGNAAEWLRLGRLLYEDEQLAAAERAFRKTAMLTPGESDALNNLALVLRNTDRPEESVIWYGRAHRLAPGDPGILSNMAIALRSCGRIDESMAACDQALAIEPAHATGRFNRGLGLLLQGRLEAGWADYEYRWRTHVMVPRRFAQPRWHGENFTGRTLLVHAEQGLGDTLQFVRLLEKVHPRGGRIILEAQAPLAGLLRGAAGVDRFVAAGSPLPPFDLQLPLLSLPGVLGIGTATIPASVPYLAVPAGRSAAWAEALDRTDPAGRGMTRVGLVWAGNPKHSNDAQRSLHPSVLAPLWTVPGVRFHSLQVGRRPDGPTLPGSFVDLAPALTDFAETAAALAGLDLLIAVDTSVVHLAGALGRPVWILLAADCDWRWMLGREDSPWYPTARLFRQERRKDWAPVIARVAQALRERVGAG